MTSKPRRTVKHGRPHLPDWRVRLNWWLAEASHREMKYGESDCVLTCADAIKAATGHDPASGIRGKYFTQAGAEKIVKRNGGLVGIATKFLGPPLASPLLAWTGDVGLFTQHVRDGDRVLQVKVLGIVMGEKIWSRSRDGMTSRPLSVVEQAWPVGRDA